jgi:hypothetical protein
MSETGKSRCPFHDTTSSIEELCRTAFNRPWRAGDGPMPRPFHAKSHGCVRGVLRVEPPVNPAWQCGLFVRAAEFPAVIRFSSALCPSDRLADGRGMAIKLNGVEGEVCDGAPPGQQDIILMSDPVAPFRGAVDALTLLRSLAALRAVFGLGGVPSRWLPAPERSFPFLGMCRIQWFRFARMFLASNWAHLRHGDLTRYSYHSITPYALRDTATKYEFRPVLGATAGGKLRGPNLRSRLQSALDRGPLRFDFYLQPRADESDSLETGNRRWKGPSVRVGHLEIPSQHVAANDALGETLAFGPWNCLRAHQPLGSVNQARRLPYRESVDRRGGNPLFPES